MSCVLPGFCEVIASPLCPVSILMSEDLPTLERPMKAYSGSVLWGQDFTEGLLCTKVAECINIVIWVLVDEWIGSLD